MPQPIICPGCNQRITFSASQGFTECGGEGNGICAEAALAYDIDSGKGIRKALRAYTELDDSSAEITVDQLAAILDAHDAVAAQSRPRR
jgi:hypothetical protein